MKITFLKKIELEKASWTELGPIGVPNKVPKVPKSDPKWSQNGIEKLSKNNIDV